MAYVIEGQIIDFKEEPTSPRTGEIREFCLLPYRMSVIHCITNTLRMRILTLVSAGMTGFTE